jgi:hypothetical protein
VWVVGRAADAAETQADLMSDTVLRNLHQQPPAGPSLPFPTYRLRLLAGILIPRSSRCCPPCPWSDEWPHPTRSARENRLRGFSATNNAAQRRINDARGPPLRARSPSTRCRPEVVAVAGTCSTLSVRSLPLSSGDSGYRRSSSYRNSRAYRGTI